MNLDTISQSDALDFLNSLSAGCADMILADLPYGTTACSWDEVIPFEPMWKAFRHVIKPRGAVIMTASDPFSSLLICSNLEWFKYRIIWRKSRGTGFINAKNRPLAQHEDIVVFSPGTIANGSDNRMTYNPQGLIHSPYHKKRNKPMTANPNGFLGQRPSHVSEYDVEFVNYPTSVIDFANPNNNTLHPTEKPVALVDYLIRTYTQPGDLVIDPTCGSGTTGIAARDCGRHYLLNDKYSEWVEVSRKRLNKPYTIPMPIRY